MHLEHHGRLGQKWGVHNGPPYPIDPIRKTPQELSSFMKNIGYKEFTALQSPSETLKEKAGSCHDQVFLEYQELSRMGKNPKCLFVIEHDGNQGGMTHSLVYYEENEKVNWFENAWTERQGITSYRSLNDIKRSISDAHGSGEYGDISSYPNLTFANFDPSDHTFGESLGDFVNICLDNDRDD